MLAGSRMCRWAHQAMGHSRQALLEDAHRPHRCWYWHFQQLTAYDCRSLTGLGECSIKAIICSGGYDERCDMLCLNSMMCNQRLGNSEPRNSQAQTA